MEFDKSKVLGPLSDGNSDYIGWKGYFANLLEMLRLRVENDDRSDNDRYDRLCEVCDACDYTFRRSSNTDELFLYFYPIEEPKEEWRPYESLLEMARDVSGCSQVSDDMISVASFLIGEQLTAGNTIYAISAINYNLDTVLMHDQWFSMERLFQDGWKWIDDQESVARRCGIKRTDQRK